jgi:hypothetical protein
MKTLSTFDVCPAYMSSTSYSTLPTFSARGVNALDGYQWRSGNALTVSPSASASLTACGSLERSLMVSVLMKIMNTSGKLTIRNQGFAHPLAPELPGSRRRPKETSMTEAAFDGSMVPCYR